jgi:hypothetical protein
MIGDGFRGLTQAEQFHASRWGISAPADLLGAGPGGDFALLGRAQAQRLGLGFRPGRAGGGKIFIRSAREYAAGVAETSHDFAARVGALPQGFDLGRARCGGIVRIAELARLALQGDGAEDTLFHYEPGQRRFRYAGKGSD